MIIRLNHAPFHYSFGERGEVIAWDYLMRRGYRIVEKNYRCKLGEIDIIAEKNNRLAFIEVNDLPSPRGE